MSLTLLTGITRRFSFVLLALIATAAIWAAPRNVIIMIGDGMSTDIIQATGAYLHGAEYHAFGGEKKLNMETLSQHYYVTTFSTNGKGYDTTWNDGNPEYVLANATDSAAAGTALSCGVKTYNGAIGVDAERRPVQSITELARLAGLKTGVITSVPFFDATPAAFAAHNTGRGNASSITHEMLMVSQPDVLMGAGNPDSATPANFNSISEANWTAIKAGETPYTLVQDRDEFLALIEQPAAGKVLGLFRSLSALKLRNADGKGASPAQPTLAEMTHASLSCLKNPQGFVLMVEGGNIDKQAHPNNLNAVIGETIDFDNAVGVALKWIADNGGWQENLLIITADHDTGYLNSVKPTEAGQLPTMTWGLTGKWGSHTNRLVDLFCMGVTSERFASYALKVKDHERGMIALVDNTDIFQVMRRALPVVKTEE